MKKNLSIKSLAKEIKCHPDTLYKAQRGASNLSKKMSKKLSKATGLPWLMFFAPEEYGNPWKQIFNE